MNTNTEPTHKRSLEPDVDLRTIPSGWDMSGFYAAGERWVNEPQHDQETSQTRTEPTRTTHDTSEDAV